MGEDVGDPLQVPVRGHEHHHPGAREANAGLDQHQQPEAQHQQGEQVPIRREDCVIDHPLHEEGADQGEDFERYCQQQNLQENASTRSRCPSFRAGGRVVSLPSSRSAEWG